RGRVVRSRGSRSGESGRGRRSRRRSRRGQPGSPPSRRPRRSASSAGADASAESFDPLRSLPSPVVLQPATKPHQKPSPLASRNPAFKEEPEPGRTIPPAHGSNRGTRGSDGPRLTRVPARGGGDLRLRRNQLGETRPARPDGGHTP